jgi:hypothetical protein
VDGIWTSGPSLPEGVARACVAPLSPAANELLLMGGATAELSRSDKVFKFDGNSWTEIPQKLSIARSLFYYCTCCLVLAEITDMLSFSSFICCFAMLCPPQAICGLWTHQDGCWRLHCCGGRR